jgi:hypothetical protein
MEDSPPYLGSNLEQVHLNLPAATVREFVANWLKAKKPEVSPATLAFYKKSTTKFLQFLGPAVELDLISVTRTALVEFRNQVAQKASPTTTNHDLKAIKALFHDPGDSESAWSRRPGMAKHDFFGLYTGQRLADIASLSNSALRGVRLVDRESIDLFVESRREIGSSLSSGHS